MRKVSKIRYSYVSKYILIIEPQHIFICSRNFILFDGNCQTTYDISHSNYVSVEYAFRAFYRKK